MGSALVLNATYEPLAVVPSRRGRDSGPGREGGHPRSQRPGAALRADHVAASLRHPAAVLRAGAVSPQRRAQPARRVRRDGHSCQYCGNRAETLDHVVPRSRGGCTRGTTWWPRAAGATCGKADRLLTRPGSPCASPSGAPRQLSWVLVAVGRCRRPGSRTGCASRRDGRRSVSSAGGPSRARVDLHRGRTARCRSPIMAAHGTEDRRDVVLVRVMLDDGSEGWGECSALSHPTYTE